MALAITATGFGQGLMVGDPAPKMEISKWVKGKSVDKFEKGKLYVVEFWATWCGPCKISIPHLTELAHKYKDKVDFVGVSVWEDDQSAVEPFVKSMGDKMAYNVAMDVVPSKDKRGSDGMMSMHWMKAAGRDGIPSAFIVDRDSKIAWVGHPMQMEEALAKIVGDKYSDDDYKKAKDAQEADLRIAGFREKLNTAAQSGDDKAILAVLDSMVADSNRNVQVEGGSMKFSFLLGKKQYDDAYATAKMLVAGPLKDDSDALNSIAWSIVDPQNGPEKKDLDLAMSAAMRSVELKKDSANLDTLARVYFCKGDKAKAIEIEKEAMAMAPEAEKKTYADAIKEYGG